MYSSSFSVALRPFIFGQGNWWSKGGGEACCPLPPPRVNLLLPLLHCSVVVFLHLSIHVFAFIGIMLFFTMGIQSSCEVDWESMGGPKVTQKVSLVAWGLKQSPRTLAQPSVHYTMFPLVQLHEHSWCIQGQTICLLSSALFTWTGMYYLNVLAGDAGNWIKNLLHENLMFCYLVSKISI